MCLILICSYYSPVMQLKFSSVDCLSCSINSLIYLPCLSLRSSAFFLARAALAVIAKHQSPTFNHQAPFAPTPHTIPQSQLRVSESYPCINSVISSIQAPISTPEQSPSLTARIFETQISL